MKLPELTTGEWAWILAWLRDHTKRLPKFNRNAVIFNATGVPPEQLCAIVRSEALNSREPVWQAMKMRALFGSWQKLDQQTSFWLHARWKAAFHCVERALAQPDDGKVIELPRAPNEATRVIEVILLDYWDEVHVDQWIAANLTNHVYFVGMDHDRRERRKYTQWLRSVRRNSD